MNAANYNDRMFEIIKSNEGNRPSLLLHACCAPCASACLERLYPHFDVSAFFYNPNIEREEYEKRKGELLRLLSLTGWGKYLECENDNGVFYDAVRGLENCPEGGKRCEACFYLRLEKCARTARENGFEYFATTLTLSPLKNAKLINQIGEELEKRIGVKWLYSDFKKGNGYLRSLELSREYNLYRQSYCGCIYSNTRQTLD